MTETSNAPLKACNQPNLVARTGHRVLCVNWAVGKESFACSNISKFSYTSQMRRLAHVVEKDVCDKRNWTWIR